MPDNRNFDSERARRERLRRRRLEKQRQQRRRRLIRLVSMAAILVVVFALAGTGLYKLLSKKDVTPKEGAVEVQASTTENTSAASKQPIMGAQDLEKLTSPGSAGWQQDANGWWYRDSDGSYFKEGWREIEGSQYYFDSNGYIKTGWMEKDGQDYYFDESGRYDETKKREMIALTFDDGPGKYTQQLVDCLTANNAKATFFMLGPNVEQYPDVAKMVKDAGMEVGNHTYDHQNLTGMSSEGVASEITRTDAVLTQATGAASDSMRPPGGAYNETVQASVGVPIIMWSVDTKDWLTQNEEQTYQKIMDNAKDGSVVLMHDIHEWSVKAAMRAIPDLVAKGYKLVTVEEMAQAKGVTLENGSAYYYFGEGTQQVE